MMTSLEAKKRAPRATHGQLSRMVNYFYENRGLAEGKVLALQGKVEFNRKWEKLAEELNAMGGGNKTSEQWQTVWRDLKSRTSIKMRERRKQMAQTGNKPLNIDTLSELERQIVGLLGKEYIEGNKSCPESLPEDDESQLELERGEEKVLMQPPKVLTLFNEDSLSDLEGESESSKKMNAQVTPKRTPRRTLKRNASRSWTDDQNSSQSEFLKIAKQQADALEMLAVAFKTNAEAQMRHADGLSKIADALMRLTDSSFN